MALTQSLKIEIAKYDYIRFTVYDMNGRSRGQVIPSRNAEKYFQSGLDVYQGMIVYGTENEIVINEHKNFYNHGNVAMFPDETTLRNLPWCGKGKLKVGEVLCEMRWLQDNQPQQACPRTVARQQLNRLDDMGLKLMSGFEIEYHLFHADTMKATFYGRDIMCNTLHNNHGDLLLGFDQQLVKSGVDLDRFHSEYAPGTFEAIMKPTFGMDCPDSTANLKQGLIEMADLKGLKATFMSRYFKEENGLGAHFNFSVLSKETGDNAFYDATSSNKLSSFAKQWIAGIIKHSKALTVIFSPTVNCYRRLNKPWAPGGIYWGIEDREASLRVKNHGPSGTYMENRIPSGKSNPYLVVAATVAAGLDGIINKLECPPQGNIKEALIKGDVLPKSLPEAVQALEDDDVIVNALGKEFVSWFLATRKADLKKFENIIDDDLSRELETKLYL